MHSLVYLQRFAVAMSLVCLLGAAATDTLAPSDVTKSLQTIQREADAVATGRSKSSTELRDSARTIGVEWQKVEPSVAKEFLVETRFANQSIAAFERDWKSPNLVRTDAKDVGSKIADLLDAQQKATPTGTSPASPSSTGSPQR